MTRTWSDTNGNFVPDCNLTNPLAQSPATTGSIDTCGQINNLLFGSNQFVGANFDPGVTQRLGRASVGLGVRRVGPAADPPEGVG